MFVILYTLANNITSGHHFLFTAATQSNTRQSFATKIGRKRASKCVHRSVTATKHQKCDAVLSANGRQRALQRTLVSRPRGAMFGHKVDESDVLRLQSVRIEVVAAPLGVPRTWRPSVLPVDRSRGCCTRSRPGTCRR